MKKFLFLTALCFCKSMTASAHIHFAENTAPAGYSQILNLVVPHGCGTSPVKEVHVKIPDGLMGVRVSYNRDWKIEIKNRKLEKPLPSEGGRTVTETVDEIIWTEPKSALPASGYYDTFQFEVGLPKEEGSVVFFKAYAVCEKGDDRYVEIPKEPMNARMPDFAAKLAQFIRSVPGPAPWVILTKPSRPQFPWGTREEVVKAAAAAEAKAKAK